MAWETIAWVADHYPTGDPRPLARRLAQSIEEEDLISALEAQIIIRRRQRVAFKAHQAQDRHNEMRASRPAVVARPRRGAAPLDLRSVYLEELRAYASIMDDEFSPSLGEPKVQYRLATRDDHLRRIEFQRARRDGLDRDIRMHEYFVSVLDATGVTCIDDLYHS